MSKRRLRREEEEVGELILRRWVDETTMRLLTDLKGGKSGQYSILQKHSGRRSESRKDELEATGVDLDGVDS